MFNVDVIADNYALSEILSEKIVDQYEDIYFNTIRGKEKFSSQVLTNGPEAENRHIGKNFFCKLRPVDTMHDFCLPNPCSEDKNLSSDDIKLIISMHPTAVSERILGRHQRPPRFNDKVSLSFFDEGPNASTAKMRDARFQTKSKKDNFRYKCAIKQTQKASRSFKGSEKKTKKPKKHKPTKKPTTTAKAKTSKTPTSQAKESYAESSVSTNPLLDKFFSYDPRSRAS